MVLNGPIVLNVGRMGFNVLNWPCRGGQLITPPQLAYPCSGSTVCNVINKERLKYKQTTLVEIVPLQLRVNRLGQNHKTGIGGPISLDGRLKVD